MDFPMHWLVILVVVLILFGGRKIPELIRGLGEGVRGFKEGRSRRKRKRRNKRQLSFFALEELEEIGRPEWPPFLFVPPTCSITAKCV